MKAPRQIGMALVVAMSVVAVMAFTHSDADDPLTRSTMALVDLPVAAWGMCGTCFSCPDGHSFTNGTPANPDRSYGEPDHGCSSPWSDGYCPERHGDIGGDCGGGFALSDWEKAELWAMVTEDTAADLGAALSSYGEAVSYNASRGAVQVQSCTGSIVVNIPLTSAQMDRLSE